MHCDSLPAVASERAARIRLLRRFGREDWAKREQEKLETELPAEGRAARFLCLGLPDLAIRVAVALASAHPTAYRYPRPFDRVIEEQSRDAGIAPNLIRSLARRESLFDPGAVSAAGARGLLQMMESTARETALNHALPSAPLERPDYNLALGIHHLQDLRERHDWPLPALLAAFNAGVDKSAEWVRRFPDPDLFIERIGWRETRDYVRHVLDGYWVYRTTYGGPSGGGRQP